MKADYLIIVDHILCMFRQIFEGMKVFFRVRKIQNALNLIGLDKGIQKLNSSKGSLKRTGTPVKRIRLYDACGDHAGIHILCVGLPFPWCFVCINVISFVQVFIFLVFFQRNGDRFSVFDPGCFIKTVMYAGDLIAAAEISQDRISLQTIIVRIKRDVFCTVSSGKLSVDAVAIRQIHLFQIENHISELIRGQNGGCDRFKDGWFSGTL